MPPGSICFLFFFKKKKKGSVAVEDRENRIAPEERYERYVGLDILLSLYYALIYPFLTYGIVIWGNT